MQKPISNSSEIVHQNPWSRVRHHALTWPNGKPGDYYVLELPHACSIIAIRDQHIMTVKQYRFPISQESIEIPMGGLKPDEAPEDGARRELEEESGMHAEKLEKLGTIYLANGAVHCQMNVFLCEEMTDGTRNLDESEAGMERQWIPLETWKHLIQTNQIIDGDSLAAWSLYLAKKGQI